MKKIMASLMEEEGTTIVMTTHNRDIVNQMKKRVIVLNQGKIVQDYERGKYYEVV